MKRIHVLTDDTINKIAAGEVIENPAAVVKELVENAIDAGAHSICIDVASGGFTSIIISDDGCGMSYDDALLSIERHATSKIGQAQDLMAIQTMGFRGEALASIAAISKFRMVTQSEDTQIATELIVEGGKIRFIGKGAREKGTTIEIKQLFYNVPARRKFQKSPSTSTTQIVRKVTDLALAHPHLRFEFICDGKKRIETAGQGFDHTAQELLGQTFIDQTMRMETPHIQGLLGQPLASRSTRSGQYLFVNERAIDCPLICQAIADGYATRLGMHQHPIFALHLTFPSEWIDVNVHPQKREIRFQNEEEVSQLIRDCISEQFAPIQKETITPMRWDHSQFYEDMDLVAFEAPQMEIPMQRLPIIGLLSPYLILAAEHSPLKGMQKQPNGFVLVHLKRAEERLFYEAALQEGKLANEMQGLMLPITLEYSHEQAFALEKHMDICLRCGIGVRKFGEQTFVVDALHAHIEPESVPLLIDRLLMAAKKEDPQTFFCKIPKLIPRRAPYSQSEAEIIVKELLNAQDRYTAPSGEPIFTHMDLEDVERLFKSS